MTSVGDNNTDAGAVACGGHNNAASAQFTVGAVGFGAAWSAEDSMAESIVRISRELEKAQAQIAVYEAERSILMRERDEARVLVSEMKQAIVWAKAEVKERLHRLDQAACERRTWLEAHEKMKRERDQALHDATQQTIKVSLIKSRWIAAREALQRLADCDWVITLPDRMDAVRKIARDALEASK